MKKIAYTEIQVNQILALLNNITTTGIQNAKQIAVIAQLLESGAAEEETEADDNN